MKYISFAIAYSDDSVLDTPEDNNKLLDIPVERPKRATNPITTYWMNKTCEQPNEIVIGRPELHEDGTEL